MALIDSIVSYYKLEENAASTSVSDETGTSDGTSSTNTTNLSATGKIGNSFNFTAASSEYVSIGTLGGLGTSMSSGFSMSYWYKGTQGSGTQPTPFGAEISGGKPRMGIFHNAQKTTGHEQGTIMAFYFDGDGNGVSADFGAADNGWRDGNWHHIVVTIDGPNNAIEFYIDGSNKTSDYDSQTTGDNDAAFTDPFHMASFNFAGSPSRYLDGDMDEVGFWNKILTQTEVNSLYNSGDGLQYPFSTGIPLQLNVGDVWKEGVAAKVNVGDVWKEVSGIQLNVGDTWKEVY